VTKSFGDKNIGVFLGVRNSDWNYPVTGKADNIDMMGLSYDEDGKLIKSGKLLGVLLRKDTATIPVPPATAYQLLGRTAKLKIIPPNGKDGDLVVDGLGSRAVINSMLACFDAAQALVKNKRKSKG
jgi:hypothetical protein